MDLKRRKKAPPRARRLRGPRQTTYIVVSDFHMTSGRDTVTGELSPTEDFFWDGEFARFLLYPHARGHLTLILNGDIFDILQVTGLPPDLAALGMDKDHVTSWHRLRCTELASLYHARKILDGHPGFVAGLAEFLARGNTIKFVKGNHDVQMCWESLQQLFVERVLALLPAKQKSAAAQRIEFLPWIWYAPGQLLVEHGNQYEEACSYRNFLAPFLPPEIAGRLQQIELDLASLLVRYLTNTLEPFNGLADNVRPLTSYYVLLLRQKPFLLIGTLGTAMLYVLKAFAKSREIRSRASTRNAMRDENRRRIAAEAMRFGGDDGFSASLNELAGRLARPTLEQGAGRFLLLTLRPAIGTAAVLLLSALIVIFLRNEPAVRWWAGTLAFCGGMAWEWKVGWKRTARLLPDVPAMLRHHAEWIAERFQVRFVVMGHTHVVDRHPLQHGGWYFNTGTWMDTVDVVGGSLKPSHEFTYARISGKEGMLLRWDPVNGKPGEAKR